MPVIPSCTSAEMDPTGANMDGIGTRESPGDSMFRLMSSKDVDMKTKQQTLKQFKMDAKHGNIDLQEVPRYFEGLSVAVDISNETVALLAFSALTTLVKVTAISNKRDLLKNQLYLVLPIIINKLGDSNNDIKIRAKKSLEDCWLTSHSQTSQLIMDLAIPNRNLVITLESINWINNFLINSNPQLNLSPLIPCLIEAVDSHSKTSSDNHVIYAIINLLTNFCNMKDNFRFKYKISKELDNYSISEELKEKIENSIGVNDQLKKTVPQTSRQANPLSHSSTKPEQQKPPQPKPQPKQEPKQPESPEKNGSEDPDLLAIINKLNGYKFDESLSRIDVSSADELYHISNGLSPPFQNRESEANWTLREKNIVKLRSLLRGNAPHDYLDDFKACLRDLSDGICKAISSLRTTLSSNGCQLVKELAMVLPDSFESLIDLFLPTLNKLCSSTKNIASLNAHISICSVLIHCSYSLKYMQRIYNSSIDKNIKNRSYSATWLQIMMVRFHDNPNFMSLTSSQHALMNGFELTIKSLTKVLSDPNPTVRLTAKEAYWSFTKYFSEESEALTTKLEPNVLKGIERSRTVLNRNTPSGTSTYNNSNPSSISRSNSKSSRPSIRESIIAKNKELRAKQRAEASTPISRAPSRMASDRTQRSSLNHNNTSNANQQTSSVKREENRGLERSNSRTQSRSLPTTSIGLQRQSSIRQKDSQPKKDIKPPTIPHEETNDLSQNTFRPPVRSKTTDSPGTLEAIHSNFDKTKDPMKAFLKSSNLLENEHGIDLLRYAINQNEDIDHNELRLPLLKIANLRVDILKPLFKHCSLDKCSQFFKPEDFFRISILVVDPIDEKFVNAIIAIFDLDDIYMSIDTLLGYCISLEHLQDDDSLGTQIIRYKSQIMYLIFHFMNISLNKIPISDKYFSSIISNLFELTSLAKSTKLYDPLSNLLHKLHSINQSLFTTELNLKDSQTVSEVGTIIDLDNLTDFTTHNATYDFTTTNFANLTKVFPNTDNSVKGSPFKGSSDFTMLMPVGYTRDNDYSFKPVKNGHKATPQATIPVTDTDNMQVDKEHTDSKNLFRLPVHSGSSTQIDESEQKQKQSISKEDRPNSKDSLADEFSQVQITERELQLQGQKSVEKESILSFIDKVDPLKSISEKNKHISIYEDENHMNDQPTGSPTKRKTYDYTELNWFNFQLAKFPKDFDNDVNKTEFEILTKKLRNNSMENQDFLKLLNYLQNSMKFDMDFTNYYYNEGRTIIESSLWELFHNYRQINQASILNGLIILKQLLINRVKLNLNNIFKLLVDLSELEDNIINEYDHAINEIFDELLTGMYGKGEILAGIMKTLSEVKVYDRVNKVLFIFESSLKVFSYGAAHDLDQESITMIEESLAKFLNHTHVEVRRLIILNYAKLIKNLDLKHSSKLTESNIKGTIFQKLTPPQKKLIEYYSQV